MDPCRNERSEDLGRSALLFAVLSEKVAQRSAAGKAIANDPASTSSPENKPENEPLQIVRLLLEHKADVNLPNCGGFTPLMYAVGREEHRGGRDLVSILLKSGADPLQQTNYGLSALMLARYGRKPRPRERSIRPPESSSSVAAACAMTSSRRPNQLGGRVSSLAYGNHVAPTPLR